MRFEVVDDAEDYIILDTATRAYAKTAPNPGRRATSQEVQAKINAMDVDDVLADYFIGRDPEAHAATERIVERCLKSTQWTVLDVYGKPIDTIPSNPIGTVIVANKNDMRPLFSIFNNAPDAGSTYAVEIEFANTVQLEEGVEHAEGDGITAYCEKPMIG